MFRIELLQISCTMEKKHGVMDTKDAEKYAHQNKRPLFIY